jgi:hypothetical protein
VTIFVLGIFVILGLTCFCCINDKHPIDNTVKQPTILIRVLISFFHCWYRLRQNRQSKRIHRPVTSRLSKWMKTSVRATCEPWRSICICFSRSYGINNHYAKDMNISD